jgi:uroporphyrinogen-III synthase
VITRPLAQCAVLCGALRARDAEAVLVPLIKITPIQDFAQMDAALARLGRGDWIVLTSQNAVPAVAARATQVHDELLQTADGVQIAVVGPATENAMRAAGLKIDYVAKTHDGMSLAQELGERLRGRQVLLPRSDLAGVDMPAAIHKFGAEVIEVVAYRTETAHESESELRAMLAAGSVDAIVCFSPSAVHSLADILGDVRIGELQDRVIFAAIGEVTARAYRGAGVRQPVVAADATAESVVRALSDHFARQVQRTFAGAKKS